MIMLLRDHPRKILRQSQFSAEAGERQHKCGGVSVAEALLTQVDLVEPWNVCPFPEVAARWGGSAISSLAFDGKLRAAVTEFDEIDFSFVCIPDVAQFHLVALCIFLPVAVLE